MAHWYLSLCLALGLSFAIHAAPSKGEPSEYGFVSEPRSISSCFGYLQSLSEISFPQTLADAISANEHSSHFIRRVLLTPTGKEFLKQHLAYHRNPSTVELLKGAWLRFRWRTPSYLNSNLHDLEQSQETLFEFLTALNERGEAEVFLEFVIRIHSRFLKMMADNPTADEDKTLNQAAAWEVSTLRPTWWNEILERLITLNPLPTPPRLDRTALRSPAKTYKLQIAPDKETDFSHYSIEGDNIVIHYKDGATNRLSLSTNSLSPPHHFANANILIRQGAISTDKFTFLAAKEFLMLTHDGSVINIRWFMSDLERSFLSDKNWLGGATTDRVVFALKFAGNWSDLSKDKKYREYRPQVEVYQITEDGGSFHESIQLPYDYGRARVGREAQNQQVSSSGRAHFFANYQFKIINSNKWQLLIGDQVVLSLWFDHKSRRIKSSVSR